MSIVSDGVLKGYFETGDYPTQQQFENLIDSKMRADYKIALSDLAQEVTDAINAASASVPSNKITPATGASSVVIPAHVLVDKIIVIDSSDLQFSVGTSEGAEDIVSSYRIPPGVASMGCDIYYTEDTTIYFTGVNSTTIIQLFKR